MASFDIFTASEVWRLRRFWPLLLGVWLLAACNTEEVISEESFVFGTRVQVLIWGEKEDHARAAISRVQQEFDRLHRDYHAWQPSQLTAVNEAIAAGRPHRVSPELAQLIRDAQALAQKGNHLFDPGIGGLIKLWGFQSDNFSPRLPDPARLERLLKAHPTIADLEIQGETVISHNPTVALDFGGYLKGVALDRAAAILKALGIRNALINIGGNIMALGQKGGTPWRVGIQHPRQTGPLASLELRDGEAIGTSGDYQRYFELEGRRYCHLIDPRHGRPAGATQSLSILIPPGPQAGMVSDAASKPLFIAGENWPKLAQNMGLAQVLRVDDQGRVEISPAMKARLRFETPDLKIRETHER
ncbi:FAD:protein FMN transferase [Denitratisoma oestradiolicum]|uniref:FAD:protein FMN transferase n=1 Tax=Denitratisoma oestradiolicum TaxID=311182 RepID=UPI001E4CA085|nr:FAD:protein FMN transferase [Denitratisoma oestradiolicum]